MGGNHKKNLRAEKAKVKLKGAKLPKGLNVTKTEFKVRKITIREQLKESTYIDGARQINLKETLSRLKHHSSNFRTEALRNLRDAITTSHSGLLGHLSEIVQGVSAGCLDIDKETRRESFKTLGSLLGALPTDSVAPFFHAISSYMRCAMTHIQTALQEDALLMLDVLLQHVPRLVAAHSAKILKIFLEMISRVRAEGDRTGRTLTLHMGQKQTTVKWRTLVLQRLQKMLQTLTEYERNGNSIGAPGRSCQMQTFNAKEPIYYTLQRKHATQVCDLSAIFCRTTGNAASATGETVDSEGTLRLRGYVQHLMPLMLESWLEVRPQKNNNNDNVVLTSDAALTLKVVLDIIQNIWTLIDLNEAQLNNHDLSEWFKDTYAASFANSFLEDTFPYQQSEHEACSTKSKKGTQKAFTKSLVDQYCLQQNINLAYLTCRFCASNDKIRSAKFPKLLQFLNTLITNFEKHQTVENCRNLDLALRTYLLQNGQELLQVDATNTRQLLHSTINAFLNERFVGNGDLSSKLLILFCDIVQMPQLFNAYGPPEFEAFLADLPQLLLKPTISENSLLAMSSLGKQRNLNFLMALEKLIAPVIENIQKIQVLGAYNAFEGKKHIMNLFYWTERNWSEEQKQIWIQQVEKLVTDKRIVSYFKFILTSV